MAPATAYTYFSSKNHLIAEVYLDERVVSYIVDLVHATRAPGEAGAPALAAMAAARKGSGWRPPRALRMVAT